MHQENIAIGRFHAMLFDWITPFRDYLWLNKYTTGNFLLKHKKKLKLDLALLLGPVLFILN